MINKYQIIALFLSYSLLSCSTTHEKDVCSTTHEEDINERHYPEWLKKQLNTVNVPVEYYYLNGVEFYYLDYSKTCCDLMSVFYDQDGNILCRPSGGFNGNGDGNCPEFYYELKNITDYQRLFSGAPKARR